MSFRINYIPLSFINTNEEIIKQIKNSVLFSFLLINNEETTLSHYLESTQYGYTASAQPTGSHKLVRITDIRDGEVDWSNVPYCDCDKEEKYLLTANDILVARTGGTTGKSFFVDNAPDNAVFASYLIRLRLKKGVDVDFINAFLNSYVFWSQIVEMKSGSAMPNVNAEKLKTLRLPKCDSNIQKEVSRASTSNSTNPEFFNLFEKIKLIENYYNDKTSFELELTHQLSLVKQLRQAFLREAMQGKLTNGWRASHPELVEGSHSATELLVKIKGEKEQLIKEGKLKKQKPLPKIAEEEIPFEIPENWVWCRLGKVLYDTEGGKSPQCKNEPVSGTNWGVIKTTAVQEMIFLENENKLLPSNFLVQENHKVCDGDILITRAGPKNRVGIVCCVENLSLNLILSDKTIRMSFNKKMLNPKFIAYSLNSPLIKPIIERKMTGMADSQVNISQENMKGFTIPLPPLSEQKRIVAKLDELMVYCDSLDESIKNSQTQNELLLGQVLREALEPKSETKEVKL